MAKPTDRALLQATMDSYTQYGNEHAACAVMGVSRNTFHARLREAKRQGITPAAHLEDLNNPAHLKEKLKRVEARLKTAEADALDHTIIKSEIIKLDRAVADAEPPEWVLTTKESHDFPGVPTLFLSDLHWGEVVDPKQVNGVNAFNMEIARTRLKEVGTSAVRLLTILSPKFNYPGLVLVLGGDLVNGNLREEMTATNEENIMPVVVDLFEQIGSLIRVLADKFGRVFLPCVTGNHGRATHKIWAADRHATSFEWLLYCMLAKWFADDKRITFLIPDGPDAHYRIYQHRFVLSHGDQFRGGDGVIGPLGPIIRGDFKKRARNAQLNMDYDTMLLGHFHQYMHLTKLIVNGSLVGYNEFAYANNFPYEPPCQALFLTHPRYGITFRMPVFAAKREVKVTEPWVSVK